MAQPIEPAASRAEALAHRQIELQEETNALLRQILKRLPAFELVPIKHEQD